MLGKRAENVGYHGGWVSETAGFAGQTSRPTTACVVWAVIAEDSEGLRSWLKTTISGYMLAMALYRRAIRDNGLARAVQQLEEARSYGDRNGAREALPDELIEQMVMSGARDCIVDRLRLFIEAGVNRVLIMPVTSSKDGVTSCLHTIKRSRLAGKYRRNGEEDYGG